MIDDPILDKRYPSETIKTVKIKTDCGDDGCQSDLQISGSIPPELIAGKDFIFKKLIKASKLPLPTTFCVNFNVLIFLIKVKLL